MMSEVTNQPLLVILGPTASGKTRLAVQVAHELDGEIISADSRQVYRGMDIGTGKDLSEYVVDGQSISYHLIDVVDAGEAYNLYQYQQDFDRAVMDIRGRGRVPIVCGGTGLYIEAVLKGHAYTRVPVNEERRQELNALTDEALQYLFAQTPSSYSPLADVSTRKRLIRAIEINEYLSINSDIEQKTGHNPYKYRLFGLDVPVELRRQRITMRLNTRLSHGMVNEVAALLGRGIPPEKLMYYGLEYKFITQYLLGELDYPTMTTQLETAIHQFAKRQMTFFRKMERGGLEIHWLDGQKPVHVLKKIVIDDYREK